MFASFYQTGYTSINYNFRGAKNCMKTGINLTYNDIKKDLPSDELHKLFMSTGWSDGSETPNMIENYNVPFINSTLVISAWENDCLIGVVRVLSDKMFRSIIYDLVIYPEFQNIGIGKELIKRCIDHFPNSEWLVQTTNEMTAYYEKMGFKVNNEPFLSIPCKYFT